MKTTILATFAAISLSMAACASSAQDVRAQSAHECTPPGTAVVNPDSRLYGFVTTGEGQPRVVNPGTLELQGRGVDPASNGAAVHSATNSADGRGNPTCF